MHMSETTLKIFDLVSAEADLKWTVQGFGILIKLSC